jgi:hypothetical protein
MIMKNFFSALVSVLLMASFASAQVTVQSEADMKQALMDANQELCTATGDLTQQIDAQLQALGKVQLALDEAREKNPLGDKLQQMRKYAAITAGVAAVAWGMTSAMSKYANFRSANMMTINQFGLAISAGATKVTTSLALAVEAGYLLTAQDIRELQTQLDGIKSQIQELKRQTQICAQK